MHHLKIFYLLAWMAELERERERRLGERCLLSKGLIPKWQQKPGLAKAKARSQNVLGHPHGSRGPGTWPILRSCISQSLDLKQCLVPCWTHCPMVLSLHGPLEVLLNNWFLSWSCIFPLFSFEMLSVRVCVAKTTAGADTAIGYPIPRSHLPWVLQYL